MPSALDALGWGALAASSLILGGLLGVARRWPNDAVGLVLAFGAGALISAVSFDLAEEGAQIGGAGFVGLGLGLGALTYVALDRALERAGNRRVHTGAANGDAADGGGGPALALGALLDGIPEQMVLGIGIAAGEGVGVGLLVAIFVSNLPEAIGASSDLHETGHSSRTIRRLWVAVAAVCTLATVAGYGLADATSGDLRAAIDGFAAGALLVMLVDSMIPEARRKAGRPAGIVSVLGFAVAAGLSGVTCGAPAGLTRGEPLVEDRSDRNETGGAKMDERKLKSMPLFASLEKDELRRVAQAADEVDVREGKELLHEQEFAYDFMVIEEGRAEVMRGGEHVADLGPGDVLGEMAVLDRGKRNASVVARSPMTLVVMTAHDLRRLAEAIPDLGQKLRATAEQRHGLAHH